MRAIELTVGRWRSLIVIDERDRGAGGAPRVPRPREVTHFMRVEPAHERPEKRRVAVGAPDLRRDDRDLRRDRGRGRAVAGDLAADIEVVDVPCGHETADR